MRGKVAVITGAAQGLGKAFTEVLLQRGVMVCMADVNQTVGTRTAADFCKKYGNNSTFFMQCDVKSQNEFEGIFKETLKRYKRIDIVCNNAGILHEGRWQDTIDINLSGVIRGTMLGIKYMGIDQGGAGGTIVNVASMAGILPMVFGPVYTASKHGVVGLIKAWAMGPGIKRHGVNICGLCPSLTDTAILQLDEEKVTNTNIAKQAINMLGVLKPDKVSEAFLQLIDDEHCNGKILEITVQHGIQNHVYSVGKSMESKL